MSGGFRNGFKEGLSGVLAALLLLAINVPFALFIQWFWSLTEIPDVTVWGVWVVISIAQATAERMREQMPRGVR